MAIKKRVRDGKTAAIMDAKAQRSAPADDEVSMRAYFLAERRAQAALPGDSDSDWLEARRQLFEEAGLALR